MKNAIHSMLGVSLVAVVFAACGNDQPAKAPDNGGATVSGDAITTPPANSSDGATASFTAPPASTSSAAAMSPANDTASTDRMPSDSAASVLNDAQILQMTHVANQGEIEQAKLAQSKAKDARVMRLAAMMAKDHTDADRKGLALEKKEHIDPAPSPASASLEDSAKAATRTLKGQSGSDFDMTYVDTQVKEHQDVLDAIDQKLAPSAQNAGLKAYLGEIRPKIVMHLKHARELQKQLEK